MLIGYLDLCMHLYNFLTLLSQYSPNVPAETAAAAAAAVAEPEWKLFSIVGQSVSQKTDDVAGPLLPPLPPPPLAVAPPLPALPPLPPSYT